LFLGLFQASIKITSEKYRPVANRTSLLFFLMGDLVKIHTYYIYSLAAFTQVFFRGIDLVTTPELREKQATAAQSQAKAQAARAAQATAKDKEEDKEGDESGGEEEIGSMMSDAELGASSFLRFLVFLFLVFSQLIFPLTLFILLLTFTLNNSFTLTLFLFFFYVSLPVTSPH